MKPASSKTTLRRQTRARLDAMTPEQRAADSGRACLQLERQGIWKQTQTILFYAPLPGEADVWPLLSDSLAAGKTVALPRFDAKTNHYVACRIQDLANDIQPGQFGIREPAAHCSVIALNQPNLVLVPGVAFDLRGHRLGRGKGFYDQLLALVRGIKCGVAFDEQIVPEVPSEPHDIRMDCILTPTRWIQP